MEKASRLIYNWRWYALAGALVGGLGYFIQARIQSPRYRVEYIIHMPYNAPVKKLEPGEKYFPVIGYSLAKSVIDRFRDRHVKKSFPWLIDLSSAPTYAEPSNLHIYALLTDTTQIALLGNSIQGSLNKDASIAHILRMERSNLTSQFDSLSALNPANNKLVLDAQQLVLRKLLTLTPCIPGNIPHPILVNDRISGLKLLIWIIAGCIISMGVYLFVVSFRSNENAAG